jgi:sugar/nucleoside kinase (ribokinase family)/sugar phosphate isomerase/epimerase
MGQFGCDEAGASILRSTLESNGVDLSHCGSSETASCGRGYVFLQRNSGQVSAIISGGSNMQSWPAEIHDEYLDHVMNGTQCLLLQREIPEHVNLILARYAKKKQILVLQDVGGEDRSISGEMLSLCDYIIPNESELQRLVQSLTGEACDRNDLDSIVQRAKILQKYGANNVLVTLGDQGSVLVDTHGQVLFQKAMHPPEGSRVVDETGAGDCFRAAFALSLMEGLAPKDCLEFASAAGTLAVTKEGAVPSIPNRETVDQFLTELRSRDAQSEAARVTLLSRGGDTTSNEDEVENEFPFMFGSRLNSMKDRADLWPYPLKNVQDLVKRQATVRNIGCIDFNYPQHFQDWSPEEAKALLDEYGLVAGAVCLRYPAKFAVGAMNHPDEVYRREAIDITRKAADAARVLGAKEVVVWSAYDGYDYPFQVDYNEKWNQLVSAFRECCDDYPDIKWSLEFKPTDENTRFFTVPSTGAAMLLVNEIDRPNMGLTLDFGHMLMAGENPAQSVALVGEKLFGIQLNDGYTRLAAEDGLMFGSVHPSMALETMYQLHRINFRGHIYFDTFPQRTDPVKEAEYNINNAKRFYKAALSMDRRGIRDCMQEHDAVGALNIINQSLYVN